MRTDADIDSVRLFNEYGLQVGTRVESVTVNVYGQKEWTLSTSIGTVGQGRTLCVYTIKAGQPLERFGSFTLDVNAPVPRLFSVQAPGSRQVNVPFELIVTTDTLISKIRVQNEYGLSVCSATSGYTDAGDVRTWTIPVKIGTAGERTLTISAQNRYGDVSQSLMTTPIIIRYF